MRQFYSILHFGTYFELNNFDLFLNMKIKHFLSNRKPAHEMNNLF